MWKHWSSFPPTTRISKGILAGAATGKDVFCEKPVTMSLAEADRAIAAVESAGVQLQIGFMRRFDPAYLAAKQAIDSGAIGTPIFLKNAHRGKEPIRADRPASDGCSPQAFIGSNIHDYDNARWLLGDEATAVTAVGTRVVAETAVEGFESAVSIVEFSRGGLADIEYVSSTRYGYDVRTEVIGDRGSVFIGNPNGTACVVATERGLEQPAMDHWLTRFADAYLVELEDWVERTLRGEPATITGHDGRAALEIAIRRAAIDAAWNEGHATNFTLNLTNDRCPSTEADGYHGARTPFNRNVWLVLWHSCSRRMLRLQPRIRERKREGSCFTLHGELAGSRISWF